MSISQRVGPLTFNSRGTGSIRIAPGLSYRFGNRKKSDPTTAAIALVVAGLIAAFWLATILARVLLTFSIWLGRWIYFGGEALLAAHRRPDESS
jgi:hypothetical protein